MKTYISFNLSDEVLVKLTPKGFAYWRDFDLARQQAVRANNPWLATEELPEIAPLDTYAAKADAEGFVAIPGLRFMQMFGAVSGPEHDYYNANIRLRAAQTEQVETAE